MISTRTLSILAVALLASSFHAGAAHAQVFLLYIPDVSGDVTVKGYEEQIECTSASQDMQSEEDPYGNSVAHLGDLVITKYVDRATPLLFKRAADGDVLKEVKLTVLVEGEHPEGVSNLEKLYEVTLHNAKVRSVSTAVSEGSLVETLTLSAPKVTWTYHTYNGKKVTTTYAKPDMQ